MPRRNRPQRSRRRDGAARREDDEPLGTVAQREACRTKQRFATERAADDAVYRARMEGTALDHYRCPWCEGWHLTRREKG